MWKLFLASWNCIKRLTCQSLNMHNDVTLNSFCNLIDIFANASSDVHITPHFNYYCIWYKFVRSLRSECKVWAELHELVRCYFCTPICAINDQNYNNFELHLTADWLRGHVSRRLMITCKWLCEYRKEIEKLFLSRKLQNMLIIKTEGK